MTNGPSNPQVLQTNAVTITAVKVIVGEEPKQDDKAARRRYFVNALIVFVMMAALWLWTTGHVEPFAGSVAVGGITLWAFGAWIASFSSKLLPDEKARKKWLGHPHARRVLLVFAVLLGLAVLFTRSLYVKLGNTDARRVRIQVREKGVPTKDFVQPLALSDVRPSAGRPFLVWWGTKTLTLTPTEPKGYHSKEVTVSLLDSLNVRFPDDHFERIPIVRVLPGASLSLEGAVKNPGIVLHVCTKTTHWKLRGFNNQPLYFGAVDAGIAREVAKRNRGEDFSLDVRDHLALLGMKDAQMLPEIARLRRVRTEPFAIDLEQNEPLVVALMIADDFTTCATTTAQGEITTLFLEKENRCTERSWRSCVYWR